MLWLVDVKGVTEGLEFQIHGGIGTLEGTAFETAYCQHMEIAMVDKRIEIFGNLEG